MQIWSNVQALLALFGGGVVVIGAIVAAALKVRGIALDPATGRHRSTLFINQHYDQGRS
jgi:hypothetical protein